MKGAVGLVGGFVVGLFGMYGVLRLGVASGQDAAVDLGGLVLLLMLGIVLIMRGRFRLAGIGVIVGALSAVGTIFWALARWGGF